MYFELIDGPVEEIRAIIFMAVYPAVYQWDTILQTVLCRYKVSSVKTLSCKQLVIWKNHGYSMLYHIYDIV
jgi:hypothetical protein